MAFLFPKSNLQVYRYVTRNPIYGKNENQPVLTAFYKLGGYYSPSQTPPESYPRISFI